MSNVTLKTYVISNLDDKITKIESLDLPDGRPRPPGFFVCLYGSRDSITALQDAQIKAKIANKEVSRFILKYADNETPLSRVNYDNVETAIYLNASRLTKDLESDIINLISKNQKINTLSAIIDDNPEVIDKIFKLDMFKKLNVIIWPASFKGAEKIQVAAVKDASKIMVEIERGCNKAPDIVITTE